MKKSNKKRIIVAYIYINILILACLLINHDYSSAIAIMGGQFYGLLYSYLSDLI